MICIARIFGAPLTVPTGRLDPQGVERGHAIGQFARHVAS